MTELLTAYPTTAEELHSLTARLAARATAEGLVDVAYRTIDTPIGALLLAATERGVVKIAFESEGHDAVLQLLADRISPRVLRSPARLDAVAGQLDGYFGRRLTSFDVPLDLTLTTRFRQQVLRELVGVSFGDTVSYHDLAGRAGNPNASRAVGSACATNPIPIVVPCHRVLRSDGSLGGYAGGLPVKRFLLDLESSGSPGQPALPVIS